MSGCPETAQWQLPLTAEAWIPDDSIAVRLSYPPVFVKNLFLYDVIIGLLQLHVKHILPPLDQYDMANLIESTQYDR